MGLRAHTEPADPSRPMLLLLEVRNSPLISSSVAFGQEPAMKTFSFELSSVRRSSSMQQQSSFHVCGSFVGLCILYE